MYRTQDRKDMWLGTLFSRGNHDGVNSDVSRTPPPLRMTPPPAQD